MWLLASPGPRGNVIFAPFWGQVTSRYFKLHDRLLGGQRLLRSQVQRWILVFLDKFIIGSQDISLSFVSSFIWFIISSVVIF